MAGFLERVPRWLRLDVKALVLDAGMFLYATFFLYGSLAEGRRIVDRIDMTAAYTLVFLLQFCVPLYLGTVAGRLRRAWPGTAGKRAAAAVWALAGTTAFFLFLAGFQVVEVFKDRGFSYLYYTVAAVVVLALGILLGYQRKTDLAESLTEEAHKDRMSPLAFQVGGFLAVLAMLVVLLYGIFEGLSAGWIIVRTLGAVFIGLGLAAAVARGLYYFNRWFARVPGNLAVRDGFFALVMVTLLCFWLEILFTWVMPAAGIKPGSTQALLVLAGTGYLPVRLLTELEPPYTPLSTVTGLAAAGYVLYRAAGG